MGEQQDQERNQMIPWNKWNEDTTTENLWDSKREIHSITDLPKNSINKF